MGGRGRWRRGGYEEKLKAIKQQSSNDGVTVVGCGDRWDLWD